MQGRYLDQSGMLDVIIVSANDSPIWLIFHGELIWRVNWSHTADK